MPDVLDLENSLLEILRIIRIYSQCFKVAAKKSSNKLMKISTVKM